MVPVVTYQWCKPVLDDFCPGFLEINRTWRFSSSLDWKRTETVKYPVS